MTALPRPQNARLIPISIGALVWTARTWPRSCTKEGFTWHRGGACGRVKSPDNGMDAVSKGRIDFKIHNVRQNACLRT